jgi:hypothetical protein
MDVDVMGGSDCSTVPTIEECIGWNHPFGACMLALARTYKFYLAIENSECNDYITEKAWENALQTQMVPVVWSTKGHHDALLPPHSFINCADHPSAMHCAQHINAVASNRSLYETYMQWHLTHQAVSLADRWVPSKHPHVRTHHKALCEYALSNARREKPAIDIARLRDPDMDDRCSS